MEGKITLAAACAAGIEDGCTLAVSGSGGGLLEPDALLAAIERRFLDTGHPRGLTLVHALGIGDNGSRGLNRLAHEGLVAKVIGGHWSWSARMQALAEAEAIEAYVLPAGVIMLLLREIGAGRPGLFTHVGLGTFADPRQGGGRANGRAREALSELLTIDGREVIRYRPFPVHVGLVRGSFGDAAGNLSLLREAADLDAAAVALAARNSGGRVFAQVGEVVPRGRLRAREVAVPGVLVDAVVEVLDQMQTYLVAYDPAISGEVVPPSPAEVLLAASAAALDARALIARRAADEVRPGASVNFGYGIPGGIPAVLARRGLLETVWVTVEQGIHNGELLDGDLFGAARYPEAIVPSTSQFDFYSGGGLDMAFLGMGELDRAGNVNVSRLGTRVVGPGGFVDISQNAKKVVFCGAFEAKGVTYEFRDGRLHVARPGQVAKLVGEVREITFSGGFARARGQEVLYVTERAVFRLAEAGGVELIEVAPGLDLERDVLSRMGFRPVIRSTPALMPERHFTRGGAA